jgi:folate-binding protein YgfZ
MPDKTSLHEITSQAEATFAIDAGWLVPGHFGDLDQEYLGGCANAVLFDLSHRSKIEIAGPDAVIFLQNLSTNDVARLAVGAGCELFLTTVQAKVIAHAFAYRLELEDGRPAFWLDAVPSQAERIIKHLDHYLVSEQVELADRTKEYAQLYLAGPRAQQLLEEVLGTRVLEPLRQSVQTLPEGIRCHVRRNDLLGLPGYDLLCGPEPAPEIWNRLTGAGAIPAGLATYECFRIEAGMPEYGKDIDENTLALEVGRTKQAISYAKGCFLGQEPLVRIRDLGHINRLLLGLKLSGTEPVDRGSKLIREGKEVGQVTSAVFSPRAGGVIALAYVRRGHQDPGTVLELDAGGERRKAEVTALPPVNGGAAGH